MKDSMDQIISKIEQFGIVPVVKIREAKKAEALAQALWEGGLPCAEITFRTDAAAEEIQRMKASFPEMLIGAGTVLTTAQVEEALKAGAEFIVSPGLNPEVVRYCVENEIPVLPGCSTPSDMEKALSLGLRVVKFFPAEANGGLKALRAMAPPYGELRFMPTGGISEKNIREYLAFDRILACGGSWLVPEALIESDDFAEIRRLTKEAVYTMLGFRLAHVGINCKEEAEAVQTAKLLERLFFLKNRETPGSIFAADAVEVLKSPYLGTNGHIAIGTYSVERAKAYLERKEVTFLEDSVVYREDGKMQAVYMKEEIRGFAVHLVRIL